MDTRDQLCSKGCGNYYRDRSNRAQGCPTCRTPKVPCPTAGCGNKKTLNALTCRGCRIGRPGDQNGNWQGGRTKHNKGYIMLHRPDHPRSKGNSGYVFEHILVMEECLGRYLTEFENVHHKNGMRADNSLDNLELWCKPQPAGQRVEDLVKWVVDNYSQEVMQELGFC